MNIHNRPEVLKKQMYRCDACNAVQISCDRLIPKCTRCLRKNIECCIKREIKNTKKLHFIEDKIIKFNLIGKKLRRSKDAIRKKDDNNKMELINSIKKEKKSTSPFKSEVNLTLKYFSNLNVTMAVLNLLFSKAEKNNLITMIQFPSSDGTNSALRLLISLATKLNSNRFRLTNNKLNLPLKLNFNNEVNFILIEASKEFIKYDLPFFTFIEYKGFNTSKFSYYLRAAIITCGLSRLPKSKLVNSLITYFENILYQKIKIAFSISPTFDNLQLILILMNNLSFCSLLHGFTGKFLNFLIRTCYTLGLHLPQPKLKRSIQLKRLKVFNFIMFYSAPFSLVNYPIYQAFSSYPIGLRLSTRLSDDSFYKGYIELNLRDKMDVYLAVFNDFLGDFGRILYSLSIIKDKIASKMKTSTLR